MIAALRRYLARRKKRKEVHRLREDVRWARDTVAHNVRELRALEMRLSRAEGELFVLVSPDDIVRRGQTI